MLLDPVLHPVKTAAAASNVHAPKRTQFLAISKFSSRLSNRLDSYGL
jgi:hypothetical protein